MREDTEGMNKGGEVKGGNMEREREKDIRERNEVEGREAMWSMRERERSTKIAERGRMRKRGHE